MSFEAWPSPDAPSGPLPRIEDLPIADKGYDQESVRRAFDDFYRHAAQLDASLQALEAVAAFQRDAAELRNDLRSLRALGLGGAPEPSWAQSSWVAERPPFEVPTTALRLAAEAALLIAVAVIAGVAHLRTWVIVALMAAAFAAVWLCELLAARARTRVPISIYEPVAYAPPLDSTEHGEPAPYVEAPVLEQAVGWSAFEAPPDEEVVVEALTIVEPLEDTEEDANAEPAAEQPEDGDDGDEEPAPDEPLPAATGEPKRRGWFRRRRDEVAEPDADASDEPIGHVRVIPATQVHDDPWERDFVDEPELEPARQPQQD